MDEVDAGLYVARRQRAAVVPAKAAPDPEDKLRVARFALSRRADIPRGGESRHVLKRVGVRGEHRLVYHAEHLPRIGRGGGEGVEVARLLRQQHRQGAHFAVLRLSREQRPHIVRRHLVRGEDILPFAGDRRHRDAAVDRHRGHQLQQQALRLIRGSLGGGAVRRVAQLCEGLVEPRVPDAGHIVAALDIHIAVIEGIERIGIAPHAPGQHRQRIILAVEPRNHRGKIYRVHLGGEAHRLQRIGDQLRKLRRRRRDARERRQQLHCGQPFTVGGDKHPREIPAVPFFLQQFLCRGGIVNILRAVGQRPRRYGGKPGIYRFAVTGEYHADDAAAVDRHRGGAAHILIIPGRGAVVEQQKEGVHAAREGHLQIFIGAETVDVRGAGDIAHDIKLPGLGGHYLRVGVGDDQHRKLLYLRPAYLVYIYPLIGACGPRSGQ